MTMTDEQKEHVEQIEYDNHTLRVEARMLREENGRLIQLIHTAVDRVQNE